MPSQSTPGVYHLVDQQSCTCQDAQRRPSQACKHVLAVRLHVELMKAEQPKPKKANGSVLRMVREPDGTLSWKRDRHPAIANRRGAPTCLHHVEARCSHPRPVENSDARQI